MSKRRFSIVSTVLLFLVFLGTVATYSSMNNVQNTYFSLTGTHDGCGYTFGVSGNTIALGGSTRYLKSNSSRSTYILGAYIGTSFLGYRTTSDYATDSSNDALAEISVTDTIYERFISAYTIHEIDGWQYDQTCGVY